MIFSAQTEKGSKGLILLSPELGNYSLLHVPSFTYAEGEHTDFFCPVCHADLGIHKVSKDLAGNIMIDEKKVE